MYELSVAQELYAKSRAQADAIGAGELESVRAVVGALAGVDVGLLRSAWKFVTSESADENARLVVETEAGRQVCPQCASVAPPDVTTAPHTCERCKCHMRVERGERVDLLEIRFQQEMAVA